MSPAIQRSPIRNPQSAIRNLFLALVLSLLLPAPVLAGRPASDRRGTTGLVQALQKLPVVASLLNIGAHPDDENSGLLAYASRGLMARTAYLSVDRGEGGQNLIGPELYDGIGIIRTEELLTARQFDGAEQFFTRAYDFGFSKQASEAMELWGHEETLADVVRVIRMFRPDVIVSVFAGAPEDGHGQHQAAGLLTREAFRAAADPNRFPDQIAAGLRPWQAKKLYINNTRASFPSLATLRVTVGEYSPVLGRSYLEVGLESRSMHRSQDMGAVQRKGPAWTELKLVETVLPQPASSTEQSVFDGLNTAVPGLAEAVKDDASKAQFLRADLSQIDQSARDALAAYRPSDPTAVLPATLNGLTALRGLRTKIDASTLTAPEKNQLRFLLTKKEADFIEVIQLALGLSFDVLADAPIVIPGGTFKAELTLLNRSSVTITPTDLTLRAPAGWTVRPVKTARRAIGYNELVTDSLMVTVAPNARLSRPYWRHASEHDGRVTVEPDAPIGLPWRPPDVVGHAVFTVNGVSIEITQPIQFRTADKAFGEIRRDVLVAPALAVSLTPEMAVIPMAGARQTRRFQASVWNNVRGRASGTIRLDLPDGWSATPPEASFSFTRQDQEVTIAFDVTPPRAIPAGTYRVRAVAEWNGQRFTEGYRTIAYPHIETRHLYREAASEVRVFEIRVADGLTVGYIMGGGDDVPQAISQLGVNMRLLGPEDLATGDLSQYDVIVAGIRAYEVRDDLIAHNQRLLEYVKAGGTYIVQYNKYEFNAEQYGPYPAKIRQPHDRVTREDAPVTILDPTNPVFNVPNKITSADFDGWVQERGLYFLGEWDSRYVPLLACNDPGEEPKRGGFVEARYGKGLYIYTGYAWFRQLPAGLPGAYRLFANLISLPKAHQ